jgi:hypothetical protein
MNPFAGKPGSVSPELILLNAGHWLNKKAASWLSNISHIVTSMPHEKSSSS